MSIEKLRELASKDAKLATLLNNAKTPEALAFVASNAGVSIGLDDLEAANEELSDQELKTVSGGMRGVGGGAIRMKSFMFNADGAHTCTTASGCSCGNCDAHTCTTASGCSCGNCDAIVKGASSMSFY